MEIIDKINTGNFNNNDIKEMLNEAMENSIKYEVCNKCNFVSKDKETKICNNC